MVEKAKNQGLTSSQLIIQDMINKSKIKPDKKLKGTCYLALAIENLINEAKTTQDVSDLKNEIANVYELRKYGKKKQFDQIAENYQKKLENTERAKNEFGFNELLLPEKRSDFESIEDFMNVTFDFSFKNENHSRTLNSLKRNKIYQNAIVKPYESMIGLYLSEDDLLKAIGKRRNKSKLVRGSMHPNTDFFWFYGNKENLENEELEEKVKDHEFKHLIDVDVIGVNIEDFKLKEFCADLYSNKNVKNGFYRDVKEIEEQEKEAKNTVKKLKNHPEGIRQGIEKIFDSVSSHKNYLLENEKQILELADDAIRYNKKMNEENQYSTRNSRVLSHVIALTPKDEVLKVMECCLYNPVIIKNPVKNTKQETYIN